MPFDNDIAGGNGQLVRNWLQSENYQAGVSGWRISKDGSAEFNNGTFRGSIEVGSLTGQHFIVNNPVTGDVVDVYNSSNQLVFSIDATGAMTSIQGGSTFEAIMSGGSLLFNNTAANFVFNPTISGGSSFFFNQSSFLGLNSGALNPQTAQLQLNLVSDSVSGNIFSVINQGGVFGSVMQNDMENNNFLLHGDNYSGTTDAAGHVIFNHGCRFTPKLCVVAGSAFGGTFANLTHGIDGLNATQADINWVVANTGAAFANSFITFCAIFIG